MHPEREVEAFLRQHTVPGDAVVLGVSGGADSVCMLQIFYALQTALRLTLLCVHVHHGIRAEDADADAAYVARLCEERDIPFVLRRADVPARASRSAHTGTEETARKARYEALSEEAGRLKEAHGRVFIAVAHNREDNAETVLFHLFRGTGLKGLQGIAPARDNLLRPLLTVSRGDIEAYLREKNIPWRTDSTNADARYARNRIRESILKEAAVVNSEAAGHIAQTAAEVREACRYLLAHEKAARARCESARKAQYSASHRESAVFSVRALRKEDRYLAGLVIRQALQALHMKSGAGAYYQIGRVHVRAVLALCGSENGRARLDLPGGVRAARLHDDLILYLSDGHGNKPFDTQSNVL